jgi:hypothetical protein
VQRARAIVLDVLRSIGRMIAVKGTTSAQIGLKGVLCGVKGVL